MIDILHMSQKALNDQRLFVFIYWGFIGENFLNISVLPQFIFVYMLVNGEKFAKYDNFPIVFHTFAFLIGENFSFLHFLSKSLCIFSL